MSAFQLSDKNAPAVADICRRLDGIPLALELAAARVRALSVENIAIRLNDRFKLLTTGDQTALPRQQTLRALIDWSHDLLSEAERILFRRLGVFVGGWTLEAAEAVCGGGAIGHADVLELLTRLVEKSLVALDPENGRYRLLETVRQYAQERLAGADDELAVRDRHVDYFVEFAEKARPELTGPQQGTWLARLDFERENLLTAHAWCGHAKVDQGLRLVNAFKQYWFNRGLLGLGSRVMKEALARPDAQVRNLARSRGLFNVGQLCCFMGHYGEARSYLEESLSIARAIGDEARIAAVLQLLAFASLGEGDVASARGRAEEGLSRARSVGNQRELAIALNALAQVHRVEGALDRAEDLYRQVIALARDLGDRENIAIGELNFAMVAIIRGSADLARETLLDVISIADEIGSKSAGQSVLDVSSGLASSLKDWHAAARFYGAAEAHMGYTGIRRDPADEAFLAPLIDNARGALGTAFSVAETEGRRLSYEDAMVQTRKKASRRLIIHHEGIIGVNRQRAAQIDRVLVDLDAQSSRVRRVSVRADKYLAILLGSAPEHAFRVVDHNAVVGKLIARILQLPRNVASDVRQNLDHVELERHIATRRAVLDAYLGPTSVGARAFERRPFGSHLTRARRCAAKQHHAGGRDVRQDSFCHCVSRRKTFEYPARFNHSPSTDREARIQ